MLERYVVDGPSHETIDDGKLLQNCLITEKSTEVREREILDTTIELQSEIVFSLLFVGE